MIADDVRSKVQFNLHRANELKPMSRIENGKRSTFYEWNKWRRRRRWYTWSNLRWMMKLMKLPILPCA